MVECTAVNELPALPPEAARAARDIAASVKLKVARAFSPATVKAGDEVEHNLMTIRDRLRQSHPDRAKRAGQTADRLLVRYRDLADFETFRAIDARKLGAIDEVSLVPANISAARAGELVRDLTLAQIAGGAVPHGNGVSPQTDVRQLRVHQSTLRCYDETNEWSASDEIVLGVNWISASGNTGYRWWRREDFDAGETKSVDKVFAFKLDPDLRQRCWMRFTIIEEDWDSAAAYIEQVYYAIKDELHEKAELFAGWLAGQVGYPDLGPIVASILTWVIDHVFGWLTSLFTSDVLGKWTWTFTVGPHASKWKSTGKKLLPIPMRFQGLGGEYLLNAEAVLA
jgi:hypothetical protein